MTDFMPILEYLNQKEEEYKPFDPQRFIDLFGVLKPKIKAHFQKEPPFLIQIVGTNGKGSTGRFLALMLLSVPKTVGHFTSPHLFDFQERFWVNGTVVEPTALLETHQILLSFCDENNEPYIDQASYFEYATLLAYTLFYPLEYAVVETGLGGEFDATTALGCSLSLVTPIAFDHQEILGQDIASIANTKLRSIHTQGIIGYQPFYEKIKHVIKKIQQTPIELHTMSPQNFVINSQEKQYFEINQLPFYQIQNFILAKKALKILSYDVDIKTLKPFDLKGRCQKIASNIYVDVGHNVHAAQAILELLRGQKIDLIYNSYRDKDYRKILELFKPIINKIHILRVTHDRIVPYDELIRNIQEIGLPYDDECMTFQPERIYVVFGSFSVVQTFILQYQELYER